MHDIKKVINDYIINRIVANQYRINDRIPTEIELARMFKTSRCHANQAVKELERSGIVRRIKRRGTFVEKALTQEQVYRLRAKLYRNVYILHTPLALSRRLQWNAQTLRRMESLLVAEGYRMTCQELPKTGLREFFAEIVPQMINAEAIALVILSDLINEQFFQKDMDPLFGFPGEIYILNRGSGAMIEWPFNMVRIDPFAEGLLAARYLCERGHKRVVFYQYPAHNEYYWAQQRLKGMVHGMRLYSHGKAPLEAVESSPDKNCRELCERIMRNRGLLTVAAVNDEVGVNLIESARQRSLNTPADFQLIAFDNNPAFFHYNLTTISPPVEKTGEVFARLIIDRARNGEHDSKVTMTLSSYIIERQTCR
jgi:DNA-binding LacI/PurR family transcriptional regulator